jgi:hypothetical protein
MKRESRTEDKYLIGINLKHITVLIILTLYINETDHIC